MNKFSLIPLLAAASMGLSAVPAQAQAQATQSAAPLTRAQVKMERDEFLRSHRWDEYSENWVLKSGVEPPTGVKSRAEVKAERDQFLRNNRWDEATSSWVPLKEKPRDISSLTRAEVRAETRQFMRTHRWDESSDTWVEKPVRRRKP